MFTEQTFTLHTAHVRFPEILFNPVEVGKTRVVGEKDR